MVKKMIALYILMSFLGLTSCMAQKRMPRKYARQMVNCCNEKPEQPLPFRTDGIYFSAYTENYTEIDVIKEKYDNNGLRATDKLFGSFFILFNDGTYFGRGMIGQHNIDSFFESVKNEGAIHDVYKINKIGFWGRYSICNDTIVRQFYNKMGLQDYFAEGKDLVISEGKIQQKVKEQYKYYLVGIYFIPYQDLPNPKYSWFRKQECVICDENQKLKCK